MALFYSGAAGGSVSVGPTITARGFTLARAGSSRNWANPGNITAFDAVYATATFIGGGGYTNYLCGDTFGFAIPGGAVIDGIMQEWRLDESFVSSDWKEDEVRMIKGGTVQGANRGTGANIPNSPTWVSYGGAADLWGLAWTPADINAANFGGAFSPIDTGGSTSSCLADALRITVWYTTAGGQYLQVGTVIAGFLMPATFACFFRADRENAWQCLMDVDAGMPGTPWYYALQLGPGPGGIVSASFNGPAGGSNTATTTTWTVGQNHHACAVFETGSVGGTTRATSYLDGGGAATVQALGVPAALMQSRIAHLGVNDFLTGTTNPYRGGTWEHVWYDVALTPREVAMLALGIRGTKIRPGLIPRGYHPTYIPTGTTQVNLTSGIGAAGDMLEVGGPIADALHGPMFYGGVGSH